MKLVCSKNLQKMCSKVILVFRDSKNPVCRIFFKKFLWDLDPDSPFITIVLNGLNVKWKELIEQFFRFFLVSKLTLKKKLFLTSSS